MKNNYKKILELAAIIIVLMAAIYIRISDLGKLDFQNDEFYQLGSAAGYLKSDKFVIWDFIKNEPTTKEYGRSWPYTWLVAQSFNFFGFGEWQGRLISVIFGIAFLPLIYWISWRITASRLVAFFTLYLVSFDQNFVWASRTMRMYSIFVFFAILSIYLLKSKKKWYIGLLLLAFSYFLHEEALLIIAGAYFYLMVHSLQRLLKKTLKWDAYSILFLIITALIISFFLSYTYFTPLLSKNFFGWRATPLWEYLEYPFNNLRSIIVGWIILISGLFFWRSKDQNKIYYFCFLIAPLVFFIFFALWYPEKKYILFLIPLFFIFYANGLYRLFDKFKFHHTSVKYVLLILLFAILAPLPALHKQNNVHYFRQAYEYIEQNYKQGEIILIQNPQTYYFSRSDLELLSLGAQQNFTLAEFKKIYASNQSGWVVWPRFKKYHLQPRLRKFIKNNLQWQRDISKKTNMQIYRWTKT